VSAVTRRRSSSQLVGSGSAEAGGKVVNVAQIWSMLGFLVTSLVGMMVMTWRSMSLHGRSTVDAITNGLAGLRNEMIARFERVDEQFSRVEDRLVRLEGAYAGLQGKVETIDREVHALTLKVFKDDPPKPT
jgi:hypothetical protein